jgi:anti-sigma factor RsiW
VVTGDIIRRNANNEAFLATCAAQVRAIAAWDRGD